MRWLDGITDPMDMSLGVGDGQGGLACCNSWGRKESDTTERLNRTELSAVCVPTDSEDSELSAGHSGVGSHHGFVCVPP